MPSSPVGPRRLSWLVVVVAALSQLVVNRRVGGPLVFADELGYIAAARYFAPGQPDIQMLSAFYHFGYGLVLAPLVVVFGEPASFYRAATLFNSLLAVGATIMFHRVVLLRHLALEPLPAAAAALTFALTPSLLVNTSIVWAETMLVVVLVVLLVLLLRSFERNGIVDGLLVGAAGAFAYASHPRAIVLTFAVMGVLVVGAAVGHLSPSVAAAGVGAAVAGLVAVRAVNDTMAEALYTEGSILESADVVTGLISESPSQWLAGLGGTAWYQLLATLGLGLFGLLWLVRHLPTWSRRELGPAQVVSLFLASALGVSWLVGAVISVGADPRIDQLYYGRYLDIFAPSLCALGVVWLAERGRSGWQLPAMAVGFLVAGGWLISTRGDDAFFTDGVVVQVNVPVINAIERLGGSWDPAVVGMVGAVSVAAVFGVFRWRMMAGVVAACLLFVAVAEVTVSRTIRPASLAAEERASLAGPVERLAPDGIVFLAAPYEFWSLNNLQFWADDVQFQLESHCPTAAFDVVVAPTNDARYIDWALMADDSDHGRQALIDLEGEAGLSRSVRVEVVDAAFDGEQVSLKLEIENLDQNRPLRLGGELSLHVRWRPGGDVSDLVLVDPIDIEAGTVVTRRFELRAPVTIGSVSPESWLASHVGSLDVRDRERGWLSESPCAQSSFDDLVLGAN